LNTEKYGNWIDSRINKGILLTSAIVAPMMYLRCLRETGTRLAQKPSIYASMLSGLSFLVGLACEHLQVAGQYTTLLRRMTTCLSVVGLGLSLFFESRFGTDLSVTKAQLQGRY
jgi:hypothetical protein